MKNLRIEGFSEGNDRFLDHDVVTKGYALTRMKVLQILHTAAYLLSHVFIQTPGNRQTLLCRPGSYLIHCLHGPLLLDTNILSLKY